MAIPNFDASTYLANKAAQLNRTGYQGRTDWNIDNTASTIRDAGYTLEDHYNQWGVNEGVSGTPAGPTPLTPEQVAEQNKVWTGLIQSIKQPTASLRKITPEETVAGQLETLLAADSPYLQSARNYGMQTANDRGLINTGLAAGISERAAIDAAAPIAAQDASTYAASGLSAQNANQTNSGNRFLSLLGTVKDSQNFYSQGALQFQQGEINAGLKRMDIQSDYDRLGMQLNVDYSKIQSADRQSYAQVVGSLAQQYQVTALGIQQMPDSELDAQGKRMLLQDAFDSYQSQVTNISNIYSYDVDWGSAAAWGQQAPPAEAQEPVGGPVGITGAPPDTLWS